MFIFDIFRSFLPLHNPIGFGASDFIELPLAVLLVALALISRPWIETHARRIAPKTGCCMLLIGALPIVLRLLLLPRFPIPTPYVADDFSYVFLADTLRHFRLANPTHPMHAFFETAFTLQEPSYSSIFPLGQGIALAIGWTIFGSPWAGVAASIGVFCALCYWMLRAWTTPLWALMGGVLAAIQFGPISQWMNSYWGGAVSAAAGCLVFGALPRLRDSGRARYAVLLGAGLGIQLLTRPYESIFLAAGTILFLAPALRHRSEWRGLARSAAIAALAALPAIALMLFQNKAVTGSWSTLPYELSRYQYGVPTTFTTQPNPVPHRELSREQQLHYEAQSETHGNQLDTVGSYFERLAGRARFYRFFFLPPLYLAIPFLIPFLREFRFAWVAITLALFAFGTNIYPYFYSHYIAAVTCLFVLVTVKGLEGLIRLRAGREAAATILFLAAVHFLFWYGLHLFANEQFAAPITRYETWDAINHGDPQSRIAIARELAESPGRHLVFVRYGPEHEFEEWVYNAADIDSSRVVWARDLGAAEDEKLMGYYPDRDAWLLEPDAKPVHLTRYAP